MFLHGPLQWPGSGRYAADAARGQRHVTFAQQEVGWKVDSSALSVRGTVPGATAEGFQEAAEAAKDGCPISNAIKGNVDLSVDAELVG